MKVHNIIVLVALALPTIAISQVYDDTQIRTYLKNMGGWDMTNPDIEHFVDVPSVQGLGTDKFVGLETMVYSNNSNEVFNLTRQSGLNTYNSCGQRRRSGGWGEAFRYSPGASPSALYVLLKSGYSTRVKTEEAGFCGVATGNFFSGPFPYMQTSLPNIGRSFSGTASNRATVKLDYVCTSNCPPNSVNSIWIKLQPWNMMTVASKTINISSYGVFPSRVVDMAASIISDPGATRYVDDLEHLGSFNPMANPDSRGRGGILWYGYGCNSPECWGDSPTSLRVRLYGGSGDRQDPFGAKSSFRGFGYRFNVGDNAIAVGYTNTASNRGWLKIDYTGTASTAAIPYAMKAKVIPTGPWNMSQNPSTSIPLWEGNFNVATDRITGINTTIQSDNVGNGWHITNFHRPASMSGSAIGGDNVESRLAGGLTYVEGQNVRLSVSKRGGAEPGYYDYYHSETMINGVPFNRGWVRLDYLAGSCEQGPSGYKITAIPSAFTGTCTGGSSTFNIEGAGSGIANQATTDAYTYVHKFIPSGANKTLTVKIVSQDANTDTYGFAGVMIRSGLGANARHASMLATRFSNTGLYSRWRATDGAANQTFQATGTNLKSPCWLRVKKVGNVFTTYYSTSTSNTLPSDASFIQLGAAKTITFPTGYYIGLAVSNYSSPLLSKATFTGLTEM
jgi:hypothetical protein